MSFVPSIYYNLDSESYRIAAHQLSSTYELGGVIFNHQLIQHEYIHSFASSQLEPTYDHRKLFFLFYVKRNDIVTFQIVLLIQQKCNVFIDKE